MGAKEGVWLCEGVGGSSGGPGEHDLEEVETRLRERYQKHRAGLGMTPSGPFLARCQGGLTLGGLPLTWSTEARKSNLRQGKRLGQELPA